MSSARRADRRLSDGTTLFFRYTPDGADPTVAEAMIRAANYAQSRLGGRLLDPEENTFSPEVLRDAITELESGLRAAGFAPGEESTRRLI